MVLSTGEILKVRLYFGDDTKGSQAWYKVRIDNQRNNWYDYVELTAYEGFGNTVPNYHDFIFKSTNFNRQFNEEYYEQDTIDGTYLFTITGSNGHYVEKTLTWKNSLNDNTGGWVETDGLMAYNVP